MNPRKITPLQKKVLESILYNTCFETSHFKFLGKNIAIEIGIHPASLCNAFKRFGRVGIVSRTPTKHIIEGTVNLGHPIVMAIIETMPESVRTKRKESPAIPFGEVIPDYRTGTIRR